MNRKSQNPAWGGAVLNSALRRSMAARSPETFGRVYLDHYFEKPPSRMHKQVFYLLQTMTTRRKGKVAIAAPRGHAKSTIVSLSYVLWCVCYRQFTRVFVGISVLVAVGGLWTFRLTEPRSRLKERSTANQS